MKNQDKIKTMYEQLNEKIVILEDKIKELILNYSSLKKWCTSNEGCIILPGIFCDHTWNELNKDGLKLQGETLELYNHIIDIIHTLTKKQPQKSLEIIKKSKEIISNIIEQNNGTWRKTKEEALEEALQAMKELQKLIESLYITENIPLLVPDTNALLINPHIEEWRFPDFPKFKLVLTPTVLSELDKLKINSSKLELANKAKSIIKQIKEYRRRGKLTEGVTLVKNVSEVIAMASEPTMEDIPSWLDSNNNDDRIIAKIFEIICKYPNSPVVLVTCDINLQNKAEFACILYCEPPA